MVIIEGTLSERAFAPLVSKRIHASRDKILLGLSRICAGALFVYVFLKALELLHGREWALLGSGLGFWYLLEILGFVVAPCVFFVIALGQRNFRLIRIAAIMTLVGIVLNRLNISVIAYNWDQVVRYFPSWMEVEVTLGVICAEIWAFRWIVNRMPVLSEPPAWAEQEEPARPSAALGRT
jgi:Ni/Fe-hydrogenase subunit HybB-like protein